MREFIIYQEKNKYRTFLVDDIYIYYISEENGRLTRYKREEQKFDSIEEAKTAIFKLWYTIPPKITIAEVYYNYDI